MVLLWICSYLRGLLADLSQITWCTFPADSTRVRRRLKIRGGFTSDLPQVRETVDLFFKKRNFSPLVLVIGELVFTVD